MQRASAVSDRVDGRTTPMRLLIVEDEQKVAMALREGLEGEGYEVTIASTGAEAFSRVNSDTFEIVLLDLTLPERDGLEILTALRQRRLETRVLILTARDTLARDVWHERGRSSTLDNVIDVHIARLRKKIDLDQPTRLIHTVRGVGFMVREGS